jgi:hypothetical protein
MRIAVASVATFIDEQTHFVVGQANAALVSVACDEALEHRGEHSVTSQLCPLHLQTLQPMSWRLCGTNQPYAAEQ